MYPYTRPAAVSVLTEDVPPYPQVPRYPWYSDPGARRRVCGGVRFGAVQHLPPLGRAGEARLEPERTTEPALVSWSGVDRRSRAAKERGPRGVGTADHGAALVAMAVCLSCSYSIWNYGWMMNSENGVWSTPPADRHVLPSPSADQEM